MTRLLMAENEPRSVQAYRWWLSLGQAAVLAVLLWVATTLQEATKDITLLKIQVSTIATTMDSRFNAQTDRLRVIDDKNVQQDARMDRQDTRFDELVRMIYRGFAPVRPKEPSP